MLNHFKSVYLKTRVIDISFHLPTIKAELVKMPLLNPIGPFLSEEGRKMGEARFLSHVVEKWNIDRSGWSKSEADKFEEGKTALAKFRNLFELTQNLESFVKETYVIWEELQQQTNVASIFQRSVKSRDDTLIELEDCIERYNAFLEQIKEDTEWTNKFKTEGGFYLHLIYNQHDTANDVGVFSKLNQHHFFK